MRPYIRPPEEAFAPQGQTDLFARHVVFDCETTGLSPRWGHRIIEIGAVTLENGLITGEFSSLVDAGVPIPVETQAIHGISGEMLEGQPQPVEVYPRFAAFIEGSTLIAHNAAFDIGFLRHEFRRLQIALPNRHLCTLELSQRRLPRLADHRLETVYQHLFPEAPFLRQRHRALDDARLTAQIWLKLAGT